MKRVESENDETQTIEVEVKALALDERTNVPVVLLKEIEGERILPIWIGPAEASAIAIVLEDIEPQRPMTHDLMLSLVDGFRASVQKIVITELKDNTFFARIILIHGERLISVDARPSDSLALALRAKAPIYVTDSIFDRQSGPPAAAGPEDRAEALRRYLRNLDLKDFGRLEE